MMIITLLVLCAVTSAHKCLHDVATRLADERPFESRPVERAFHADAVASTPVNLNITILEAPVCSQNPASGASCSYCTEAMVKSAYYFNSYLGGSVQCTVDDVLTAKRRAYAASLLNAATKFLTSSLALRGPLTTVATTAQTTCSSLNLPTMFATSVDATSNIFFVWSAVPLSSSYDDPRVVVWSRTCQSDVTTGRAIIVHLNIVPNALRNAQYDNALTFANDVNAVLHEMMHVLGMRTNAFAKRGVYGIDGTYSGTSVGALVSVYSSQLSKYVNYAATPRAQQAVRQHTACGTVLGVAAEDASGPSADTALHWEMRLFAADVMTSERATVLNFHSNLTLSYLEDQGVFMRISGNLSPWLASHNRITFGAGWGCSFTSNICSYNATRGIATSGYAFAQLDSEAQSCTQDRYARGFADAFTFSTGYIPSSSRYYGAGVNGGGSFAAADYCPLWLPYNNGACIDSANRDDLNILGSTYGPTSRCFVSDVASSGFSDASTTRCFAVSCSNGVLEVSVSGYNTPLRCPTAGGIVSVPTESGYTGSIVCPPMADVCNDASAVISEQSRVSQPVWSYQGRDLSQAVSIASPFVAATDCTARFEGCFLPALDAQWASGDCGTIATAMVRCYAGDCVATLRKLMEQPDFTTSSGRVVKMFARNCSDAQTLSQTCAKAMPSDLVSYCRLSAAPSAAMSLSALSCSLAFLLLALALAA